MTVHNVILGVSGSPRKGGNSDVILAAILAGAKHAGVQTEALHLRDYHILPCIACERCRKDKSCTGLHDGMQLIYPRVERSRGLVLVSPTYHYNVSAQMKIFIDRLYQYYDFGSMRPRSYSSRLAGQGRAAVVAAICEQITIDDMGRTLEMLRRPLEPLGYDVLGELPVLGHFDKAAVKKDEGALARAHELGAQLATQLNS